MTQPVGLHHAQFFWADMWLLCLILFFWAGGVEKTIKPQYNFQQKKGPKVTFLSLTDIRCY